MEITDIVASSLVVAASSIFTISFKVIDGIQDSSGNFITDSSGSNITAA